MQHSDIAAYQEGKRSGQSGKIKYPGSVYATAGCDPDTADENIIRSRDNSPSTGH